MQDATAGSAVASAAAMCASRGSRRARSQLGRSLAPPRVVPPGAAFGCWLCVIITQADRRDFQVVAYRLPAFVKSRTRPRRAGE